MRLICISNIANVELHSKGVAISNENRPIIYDWLKIGKTYIPANMVGKVFIDTKTGELIDAVIIKEEVTFLDKSIKQVWVPANLFMELEDWREQQLNKIL